MYWNINEVLSNECLFNFIVGNRGCGKSYGAKEYVIKRFIKTGEQFMYVRRYKTELKKNKMERFFSDIVTRFPKEKLSYSGGCFYINDKLAGYTQSLSTAKIEKSSAFPFVTTIVFDEFLIDKGNYRYLTDEVTSFLELFETVARDRENVKVFFLANAISFTNPYFLFFDLEPPRRANGINKKKDILIQYVNNPEFIAHKKMTRFAKLIDGTEYAKYSIDNEMLRDNVMFVDEQPKKPHYYFTIKSGGQLYGVWFSEDESYLFISEKFDASYKTIYTTMLADHTPNTMLLKGVAKSDNIKTLEKAFRRGLVRFDSIKTKNIMMETLKILGG